MNDKIDLNELKNKNKQRLENINLEKHEDFDIFADIDIFEELAQNFNNLTNNNLEPEEVSEKQQLVEEDFFEDKFDSRVKTKDKIADEVDVFEDFVVESDLNPQQNVVESDENINDLVDQTKEEEPEVVFSDSILDVEEQHIFQISKKDFFVTGNSILTFVFEDEIISEYFDLGFSETDINKGFGELNKINTLGKEEYSNLYIVGLGTRTEFSNDLIVKLVKSFIGKIKESINIDLITLQWASKKEVAKIICEEYIATHYNVNKITKQEVKKEQLPALYFATDVDVQAEIDLATITVQAQNFAKDLMYLPANVLTPDVFVDFIKNTTSELNNVSIDIKDTEQLFEEEFGLLTAVNMGSDKNAYLVTLEFNNDLDNPNYKSLVGKGITFDTGGYSLKPVNGMLNMHSDMGGAAISLATFIAIAKLNVKTNLRVVLAISENLVNGRAFRVEDVLVSKSGKTVQVISTDAEGRLVLADALTHAQSFTTNEVITLATLTASNYLTDFDIVPIFSNSEDLSAKLLQSGYEENDYMWPMPLDHYNRILTKKVENSSKIADCANKSAKAGSPMIYGANFIYSFVEQPENTSFAHLDIGGQTHINSSFETPTLKALINYYKNNSSI